jgi:hypothetical protein
MVEARKASIDGGLGRKWHRFLTCAGQSKIEVSGSKQSGIWQRET